MLSTRAAQDHGTQDPALNHLAAWRTAVEKRLEAIPPAVPGGYIADDAPLDGGDGWILSGRRVKQHLFDSGGDDVQGEARLELAEKSLVRTHRELAALGIRLIVVPAPDKSDVVPERVVPLPEGVETVTLRSARLYQRLRAAGVTVVELESRFRAQKGKESGPLYMLRDTHWSPAGARLAAQAVAGELETLRRPRTGTVERENQSFSWNGDLAKNWQRAGKDPFPAESHTFVGVALAEGTPFQPDPASPVWVLGDSYSVFPYNGFFSFWAYLSYELGFPVHVRDRAGGGNAILNDLRQCKTEQLASIHTVVLVFTNCSLYEEDFREIPLLDTPLPPAPLRNARVRLLEDMPGVNPDTADYAHALAELRATVDRGDGAPVEMLLRVPVMRDRKRLPAAHWQAGMEVRLDLLPLPPPSFEGVMVVGAHHSPSLPLLHVVDGDPTP